MIGRTDRGCRLKTHWGFAFATVILLLALSATATDLSEFQETTTDLLGIYRVTPTDQMMAILDVGARVVNLVDLGTFFALWVPDDYGTREPKRVLVLMHGTDGSAYAEISDELDLAQTHGYALVSIQWWKGLPDAYYTALQTYSVIELALRYMADVYETDPHKAALVAFSRGSAQSFEITYWDRALKNECFTLTISHSGGIPTDCPPPFIQSLLACEFGGEPFDGARFFLYCGMKDEEWGIRQCIQMRNAEQIVTAYGGIVEEFIEDPDGLHLGYRLDPTWHEAGIDAFLRLTAD